MVRLGSRREDRFGQLVTLLQAGWQFNAAHGLRLLILFPTRAGQIAAHHTLDGHDAALSADHHPAAQRLDGLKIEEVGAVERGLEAFTLKTDPGLIDAMRKEKDLTDDIQARIKLVVSTFLKNLTTEKPSAEADAEAA